MALLCGQWWRRRGGLHQNCSGWQAPGGPVRGYGHSRDTWGRCGEEHWNASGRNGMGHYKNHIIDAKVEMIYIKVRIGVFAYLSLNWINIKEKFVKPQN